MRKPSRKYKVSCSIHILVDTKWWCRDSNVGLSDVRACKDPGVGVIKWRDVCECASGGSGMMGREQTSRSQKLGPTTKSLHSFNIRNEHYCVLSTIIRAGEWGSEQIMQTYLLPGVCIFMGWRKDNKKNKLSFLPQDCVKESRDVYRGWYSVARRNQALILGFLG